MGRVPLSLPVVICVVFLAGCGVEKTSADDVEEFLTSGKAFLPERGYTAPACEESSRQNDWDYVCTYTIDGQPWHLGVNVDSNGPTELSGAVPASTALPRPK